MSPTVLFNFIYLIFFFILRKKKIHSKCFRVIHFIFIYFILFFSSKSMNPPTDLIQWNDFYKKKNVKLKLDTDNYVKIKFE